MTSVLHDVALLVLNLRLLLRPASSVFILRQCILSPLYCYATVTHAVLYTACLYMLLCLAMLLCYCVFASSAVWPLLLSRVGCTAMLLPHLICLVVDPCCYCSVEAAALSHALVTALAVRLNSIKTFDLRYRQHLRTLLNISCTNSPPPACVHLKMCVLLNAD